MVKLLQKIQMQQVYGIINLFKRQRYKSKFVSPSTILRFAARVFVFLSLISDKESLFTNDPMTNEIIISMSVSQNLCIQF